MVRKIKGYTVFELLIVTIIIAILSVIFLREIYVYIEREKLKDITERFAANINNVKTKSIITSHIHGLCYNNETKDFIFFIDNNKDSIFSPSDDRQLITLKWPNSNVTNNIKCPNAVIFDRRGEIVSGGDGGFTVNFFNIFGEKMTVTVNSMGRISIIYGR